jgi:hypothetical protein
VSFETAVVPARKTRDRPWVVVAFLFALVATGYRLIQFLADGVIAIRFPWELDYGEGIVWEQMRLMMAGRGYGAIDGLPAIVFHYPPVYHSVTAAISTLGGLDPLAVGRSVSLGSTLLIALFGGLIAAKVVRADCAPRTAALCGLVAFLATFCFAPVGFWAPLMRVDMLSIALSFAGVLVAMAALKRPRFILISAGLFVAAVFTKQISIVAPAAVFLTFLLLRPRLAWTLAAACTLIGLAVLGGLMLATDGRFVRHIFLYNVNRFDPGRLTSILGAILVHYLFAAALIVGFAQRLRSRLPVYRGSGGLAGLRARLDASPGDALFLLVTVYAVLAGVMALGVAKSGSNVNYFIEGMAVLAILLGIFAADAANAAFGLARTRGRGVLFHPLLIPLMIGLQAVNGPGRNNYVEHRSAARVAELKTLQAMIRAAPKPVVSDDMVVLMRSGKAVQWEPAIFAELARTGDWNEQPFVDLVKARHFAFFVTVGERGDRLFDSRYNPAVADAMYKAYPQRRTIADYTLHLPPAVTARP